MEDLLQKWADQWTNFLTHHLDNKAITKDDTLAKMIRHIKGANMKDLASLQEAKCTKVVRVKMRMMEIMSQWWKIKMMVVSLVETQEHRKLIRLTIQVVYRLIVRKDAFHQVFQTYKIHRINYKIICTLNIMFNRMSAQVNQTSKSLLVMLKMMI